MIVPIDNRIILTKKRLPKGAITKIKKAFRYHNPEYFKLKNMGRFTGNTPRLIATFKAEDEGKLLTIPRGGRKKLAEVLREYGVRLRYFDRRFGGEPVDFSFDKSFILRPYQRQAVDRIIKAQTCLIEGGPASGKTEILLAAIAEANLRTGVLVHDRNLFNQWIESIHTRLGIPKKEIGRVGGGKFKIGDRITVLMQQSARNKIDQLQGIFGFLAADEVHHYAARTFLECVDSFDSKYRVGVSATIKRQDLKQFLTYDLFGQVVFSIGREELVELGYTTDIEMNIVYTDFEFDYQNEVALMDHFENTFTDYEDLNAKERREAGEELGLERKDFPEYLDASSGDSDRNNLIYTWVKRKLDEDKRGIIFTKRREHCRLWADRLRKVGIDCVILWGAQGSKAEEKRIATDLQRLKDGEVRLAIGTVLDEGINIPVVDFGMISYRNAKNYGQLEQQAGRLARLFEGKDKGELFYFHDANITQFEGDVRSLQKRFKRTVIHEKTESLKRKKSIRNA